MWIWEAPNNIGKRKIEVIKKKLYMDYHWKKYATYIPSISPHTARTPRDDGIVFAGKHKKLIEN